MLKIRDIVIANKVPRRLELQPNLVLQGQTPEYKGYEPTFAGICKSYIDRFNEDEIQAVNQEWASNYKAMRYL
jgi:dipeptidyl-peptidase-3